jgi:hypothetical protein
MYEKMFFDFEIQPVKKDKTDVRTGMTRLRRKL